MSKEVLCDGCGTPMVGVFDFSDPDVQPLNGLIIRLEGGYGMFFDDLCVEKDEMNVILCYRCSCRMMDAGGPIGKKLTILRGEQY
mgnify:CR=1 FL=1